ncbi:hypothetical protein [uncultured Tateyamaria sp.]|uniref:hypothetical protein n=1 Tax=uncultured Tateyamaria sp. TaxID=455651 RepID=UPI00262F603B|nr:hypothetical protein [uncultured Tateyamaria sp.]
MVPRAALVGTGAAAAILGVWVGVFSVTLLRQELGCSYGPETQFWGYDTVDFTACFATMSEAVIAAYRDVLTGTDRALAIALAAFLALWSLHLKSLFGVLAALTYGVADLGEGVFLVRALDGDLSAVALASVLTSLKVGSLVLSVAICFWKAHVSRRMT